jgi:hypothetical protein
MKNKTLKNLIALVVFSVFVVGVNSAHAQDAGQRPYISRYVNPAFITPIYNTDLYSGTYYNNNSQTSQYNTGAQYNYAQQDPYTYVQSQPRQQVQYVSSPSVETIKYVPVETVKYVNTGNTNTVTSNGQSASVARATSVNTAQAGTYNYTGNTGTNSNTGQYINYDANRQALGASVYGYNNAGQQTVYDENGVTALSVAGSGGFMPSSIWQWFLLVLLILAIVIVARMVSKTFSNNHGAVAH